jgi:16S rRNA (cytosine1402-N4)-methyltransferase
LLAKLSTGEFAALLRENADEPHADSLAAALAGRSFATTGALREAIARATTARAAEERELTVRRVFQALRIAVNDEFSALEAFLRVLPDCLTPGGRVAILTFHSGEDRRVKKSFAENLRQGRYAGIASEVLRPSTAERHQNPRSTSAKLRWASRAL